MLGTLVYKSERALPFEQFRAQLERQYEILAENSCVRNDNEKVRDLWTRIQAPFLAQAKSALMTSHTIKHLTFEQVMDHFAILIPQLQDGAGNTSRVSIHKVQISDGRQVETTHKGEAPTTGAFLSDGTLFTGKYTKEQWNSDSVRAHHSAIKAARAAHKSAHGGGTRKGGKRANQFKKVQRQNKKLKASISKLESRVAAISKGSGTPKSDADKEMNHNAGDAFGGRQEAMDDHSVSSTRGKKKGG